MIVVVLGVVEVVCIVSAIVNVLLILSNRITITNVNIIIFSDLIIMVIITIISERGSEPKGECWPHSPLDDCHPHRHRLWNSRHPRQKFVDLFLFSFDTFLLL